jgi:lactoylglutathione lyase
MFGKIAAAILLVSDIKKSVDFYRDTLGMQLRQEPAEDWVEFLNEGSTVIALHPLKKRLISKNRNMLIGFNMSDLENICHELEKKEVKFQKQLTDESFGKHAIIEDPDGHLISLVEMKPKEEFVQSPYYHGFAPV